MQNTACKYTPYEQPFFQTFDNGLIRPGGLALTEEALSYCTFSSRARILDIGCGHGTTVRHLRKKRKLKAYGIDISGRLLVDCRRQHPPLPVAQASAHLLPVPDACCEGIICECVLSLTPDSKKTLQEFNRVLLPDGYIIISDTFSYRLFNHTHPASRSEAIEKIGLEIASVGFCIKTLQDHTKSLKEFTARIMLTADNETCGVLQEAFLPACSSSKAEHCHTGYYLAIAQKEPC